MYGYGSDTNESEEHLNVNNTNISINNKFLVNNYQFTTNVQGNTPTNKVTAVIPIPNYKHGCKKSL